LLNIDELSSPQLTPKTVNADTNFSSMMNLTYEDNTVNRFSGKPSVEEAKNLIALHNLSEEKLNKVLGLGGFPMPSIAITRTDVGHTNAKGEKYEHKGIVNRVK